MIATCVYPFLLAVLAAPAPKEEHKADELLKYLPDDTITVLYVQTGNGWETKWGKEVRRRIDPLLKRLNQENDDRSADSWWMMLANLEAATVGQFAVGEELENFCAVLRFKDETYPTAVKRMWKADRESLKDLTVGKYKMNFRENDHACFGFVDPRTMVFVLLHETPKEERTLIKQMEGMFAKPKEEITFNKDLRELLAKTGYRANAILASAHPKTSASIAFFLRATLAMGKRSAT